jgi:hypothetical protein
MAKAVQLSLKAKNMLLKYSKDILPIHFSAAILAQVVD